MHSGGTGGGGRQSVPDERSVTFMSVWTTPDYEVIETSLELTAYFLSTR
ncbi:coenzyme PQQ precursor peptide PqqA [Actinomadura rupiterrae]|nr:coenzyme PQQ precursor peptide PqqA [Actinomadura rupiterrae]